MKYIQMMVLFLFLLAAAGCKGDDPTATPFVIPDAGSSETNTEIAPAELPSRIAPAEQAATEQPVLPTETPTSTPTPTSTLVISTVPANETPLAPGIKATVQFSTPDIAATIAPILTMFPDLNPDDIDLDNLPQLPGGLELPGGIDLPDLPLPSLPGG